MVDYPNSTKAKKYYLCLSFEHGYKTPAAKVAEQEGGAAAAKFDVSSMLRERERERSGIGFPLRKKKTLVERGWGVNFSRSTRALNSGALSCFITRAGQECDTRVSATPVGLTDKAFDFARNIIYYNIYSIYTKIATATRQQHGGHDFAPSPAIVHASFGDLSLSCALLINPPFTQGGSRERRGPRGKAKKGKVVKTRNWVLAKKDQQRRQGRDVRDDNKFTGRKRKDKF